LNILETHIVPEQTTPTRLQDYAVGIFQTASTKSAIKKAIKKELVWVNGELATTAQFIHGNEEIVLLENTSKHKHFELDLEVLFEDEYLAIIHKPAGVSVSGNSFATIDNALRQNLQPSPRKDAVKPRPVHRLDYPTSGVLLIGKTSASIQQLSKLFENKEIQKTYHAVTMGKMERQGEISLPVDGKETFSEFQVLQTIHSERFDFLNLVKLSPKTGRRHQLRKHLSAIGNPILGDKDYGQESLILKGKGMYLHASQLEFTHPFTQEEIKVNSEFPKKFLKLFSL
jgi:23S rRNA pseudouridine1911/1915/1917 synthase